MGKGQETNSTGKQREDHFADDDTALAMTTVELHRKILHRANQRVRLSRPDGKGEYVSRFESSLIRLASDPASGRTACLSFIDAVRVAVSAQHREAD